jgi:hypothetical protein
MSAVDGSVFVVYPGCRDGGPRCRRGGAWPLCGRARRWGASGGPTLSRPCAFTAASQPAGSGSGCCLPASPAPSPAALPSVFRVRQADCPHVAGRAEPHHGKARNWLLEGAGDSRAPPHLPDVETPGSDDRDRSHVDADDDLDIPVIEFGFGQINGHVSQARVDLGETAHLPAALKANRACRGGDL